jgi:hypothetical protein
LAGEIRSWTLEESEIMLDWETLVRDAAKRELISYLDIHRVKKDLFDCCSNGHNTWLRVFICSLIPRYTP